MKTPAWKLSCGALAVAATTSLTAVAQTAQPAPAASASRPQMDAMQMTSDWPSESKKAVDAMIKKYGAPNEVTATRVIW
ncbi:MAG: hypothetical protein ACRECQ_13575, partial [Burkholderiaceae bacterium]